MCIRDSGCCLSRALRIRVSMSAIGSVIDISHLYYQLDLTTVSYTHLRAHETVLDLVCRLLLEKKKTERVQGRLVAFHVCTPMHRYVKRRQQRLV